jgi:hypothetical protein
VVDMSDQPRAQAAADTTPPRAGPADAEAPEQQLHADLATVSPGPPPRFGQLTHTCFHAADGTGGWQVKEVTGGITGDEERLLETRTAVCPPGVLSRLPPFLGLAEVDRLPRRLVYGPVDPSRPGPTAYWHAVPAGADSFGRPGNVFTHVLIDRAPDDAQPPLRPGDLLRSAVWMRPFGAEQVLAATTASLPDPPWPDPVLDRTAVLAFLVEKALWRGGTLRGLLDAVHAAMEQKGPMVVLGVVDPADADRWVAAVGHLMSPGTSRRLYFCTVEHVGGLVAARAAGRHLVVVPATELRSVEPDDTVVLISDEDLIDGHPVVEFVDYDGDVDAEQVHTTAYGSRIRATPWSMIAVAVLRDTTLAAELLDRQDAIAAMVGDRDLGCAWPLALAIVERGLDNPGGAVVDLLDDALPAARTIAQDAPPGAAGPRLQQIVQRLREEALGRTAADAWTVLRGKLPPGLDVRTATATYLKRAVQDRRWLLRDGGVPLPDLFGVARQIGDLVVTEAHSALGVLATEPLHADGSHDPDSAAVALRLLDLVARMGLAAHLDPARLGDVLDRVVRPVLLHPSAGPELVERVGPLTEATQARIVRPWLDRRLPQLPGRPGCRLAPLVLRWLFPQPPVPPPAASTPPPTLVEAAAQASLVLPDRAAFRAVALIADLAGPPGPTTRAALGPGLPADAVLALLDRVEPRRLADVLGPTLLSAPAGPDLDALLERLRWAVDQPGWDTPAGHAARDARELRELGATWQLRREGDDQRPAFRRFAGLLRPRILTGEHLAADLVASAAAADVVDRIHGFDEDAGPPLALQRDPAPGWRKADAMVVLARRVTDAVRMGAIGDLQVVLAAQLGARTLDGRLLGPASWRDLDELCWTTPKGSQQHLLDQVVRLRLPELNHERPDELDRLIAEARSQVERATDELRSSGFDPHRALAEYDHFAVRWWRRAGIQNYDVLRAVPRRHWRDVASALGRPTPTRPSEGER